MTSKQKSMLFILVIIEFSYRPTTSYTLSIVTFAVGRTV